MRLLPLLLASTVLAAPALAQPATSADIAAQTRTLHNDLYAYTSNIVAALKAQPADPAGIGPRLDALHGDLQALLAQLKAMPATAATGTAAVTGVAASVTPAADLYFPASPANAKFPSPDDSRMLRNADGTIGGTPYLEDKTGAVHQLVAVTPGTSGYTVNGTPVKLYDPTITMVQLLTRQGQVYAEQAGGQWTLFNPAMGGSYNASLPDAAVAGAATPTAAAPAVPALPAPYATAPGSSGKTLTVGTAAGQFATFTAALAASADGDTIEVGTTHVHEAIPLIAHAVLIHGGFYDCTDTTLAQGKGCLVNAVDVVYDTVDVTGAGIHETSAGGTAGIRPAGTSYVTVKNSNLHGNQNGIAGGGLPWVLDVQDTILDSNGLGDGYTHNLYASTGTIRVTLERVTSTNPKGGHDIKSRAPLFSATGCTLSGDETEIDLPDGTATPAVVTNTAITKVQGAANHRIIGYGEESQTNGTAGMLLNGDTITGGDAPFIQGTGVITFDAATVAKIVGTKPTAQGVTFQGM